MGKTITIDPITRIEGHLAVRLEVDSGQVTKAFSSGEMFRGIENILRGRNPLDAQQITQRICGVCPISHGTASILAQDNAYQIQTPKNGRLIRNLILAANYIQSHIIHFYQLSALDYIDITAILKYEGRDPALRELKAWVKSQIDAKMVYPAAPFLPRYTGRYVEDIDINIGAIRNYLEALKMRSLAHQMTALFSGKVPHSTTLVPGGVTEKADARKIAAYSAILSKLRSFIESAYLPDVVAVAKAFPEYFETGKGCGNFLSYGAFPEGDGNSRLFFPSGVLRRGKIERLDLKKLTEDVSHSLFSSSSKLHPSQGETLPDPNKQGAYSWLKSPRYDRSACEVGPLARMLVAYQQGRPEVKTLVDGLLGILGAPPSVLDSVMGRHAARALECKMIADRAAQWIEELTPGDPAATDFKIPEHGQGVGLTEAPRGALGHWIEIKDYKISNYQCVVPTTWNASPRDDDNKPGPIEQALVGTPIIDRENPIEAARVVRSFDPCLACAVH